jgi:hypothetical protein
MDEELKKNIRESKTWLRGLYMLMFLVFYAVAKVIIFAVIAFQFILMLLTAKTNEKLVKLGKSLSTYLYQILLFLTFNSDEHPYPFGAWPENSTPSVKKKSKTKAKSKVKTNTEDNGKSEEK